MEMITLPKFNHNANDLEGSLGLTNKAAHYVRNAIIFECLACTMMSNEFFDKESDIPLDMKTMTGMLERTNTHMRSIGEQMYMLMIFTDGYTALIKSVQKMTEAMESGTDSSDIESAMGEIISRMTGSPVSSLSETIKAIRASNFDFDAFMEKAIKDEDYDAGENYSPKYEDIDPEEVKNMLSEMLKKALLKKEAYLKKKKEDKDKGKEGEGL